MVWFWKRKRDDSREVLEKELQSIHYNLQDSFTRIKQDIKIIKDWVSHLNDRDRDRIKDIQSMEQRLDGLNEAVSYSMLAREQESQQVQQRVGQPQQTAFITAEASTQVIQRNILDDLTDTQRSMFYRAGTLVNEAGQEWVSIKSLATDLYPNKEYDKVRSTTSEYIGVLVDTGLLQKRRKGKQTYIALTNKGESFFKKTNQKTVKKEVIKKRRNNQNL